MKTKIVLISAFLFTFLALYPQDSLMLNGNALYARGDYVQAIEAYSSLLNKNISSRNRALLFYNLGNSYFKLGELSQSILYYERCLRLYPSYADAKYNLLFAQSKITDNIEDNSAFITQWAVYIRNLLTEKIWIVISIICFYVFLIGILLFAFSPKIITRKVSFYSSFFCIILSFVALLNGFSLHNRDFQRSEAIITQGIVNAKSSPDKSGTDLFTLHEGTKVTIKETLGDWVNVHVGNNVGWIYIANLERI